MAIIQTSKGDMDESLLEKKEGQINDDVEVTDWVEYWLGGTPGCSHLPEDPSRICSACGGELVHRSAFVRLKKMPVWGEPVINIFG